MISGAKQQSTAAGALGVRAISYCAEAGLVGSALDSIPAAIRVVAGLSLRVLFGNALKGRLRKRGVALQTLVALGVPAYLLKDTVFRPLFSRLVMIGAVRAPRQAEGDAVAELHGFPVNGGRFLAPEERIALDPVVGNLCTATRRGGAVGFLLEWEEGEGEGAVDKDVLLLGTSEGLLCYDLVASLKTFVVLRKRDHALLLTVKARAERWVKELPQHYWKFAHTFVALSVASAMEIAENEEAAYRVLGKYSARDAIELSGSLLKSSFSYSPSLWSGIGRVLNGDPGLGLGGTGTSLFSAKPSWGG